VLLVERRGSLQRPLLRGTGSCKSAWLRRLEWRIVVAVAIVIAVKRADSMAARSPALRLILCIVVARLGLIMIDGSGLRTSPCAGEGTAAAATQRSRLPETARAEIITVLPPTGRAATDRISWGRR
jgi:hypothetical protein